jgi:hypothetical protein
MRASVAGMVDADADEKDGVYQPPAPTTTFFSDPWPGGRRLPNDRGSMHAAVRLPTGFSEFTREVHQQVMGSRLPARCPRVVW